MAVVAGQKNSYGDSNSSIRQVTNFFQLQSWTKFPLLALIGGGTEEKPALNTLDMENGRFNGTKLEWADDTLPPITTLVAGGGVTTTGQTAWVVTAGDGLHITKDTILLVGSELVRVTVAGDASGNVTVTRSWAGTTAATYTAGTAVSIVSRVHEEGTSAPSDNYTAPDFGFNYIQTFLEEIRLSKIEQSIARYGALKAGSETANTEREKQRTKKMLKAFRDLHQTLYYGKKVVGSAGVPSAMGGVDNFIDSGNTFSIASAALQRSDVNKLIRNIVDATGEPPTHLVCGSYVKQKLSSIFEAVPTRYTGEDGRVGGIVVDRIMSDFGEHDILFDYLNPKSTLYAFNTNYMGIGPLEGHEFNIEPLPADGDYDREQLRGVYTFMMQCAKKHGSITNISLVA